MDFTTPQRAHAHHTRTPVVCSKPNGDHGIQALQLFDDARTPLYDGCA